MATHASLVNELQVGLSPGIYPRLFDSFFSSDEFDRWSKGGSAWRLHCCGDPGCGKTTLTKLTAIRLALRFQTDNVPIASLFVCNDVSSGEAAFVEDFLSSIYHQLSGDASLDPYHRAYREACSQGKRVAARINFIREALNMRLLSLQPAFLLLDDVDRCGAALRLLLETELASLQQRGLSIMVTSRLPVFESPKDVYCDAHPSDRLVLYWQCRHCDFTVCSALDMCENCGRKSSFVEPYEHVNCNVGRIPSKNMRTFVAWSLEREHGDLGLGSINNNKPPLSILGTSIREDRTGRAAQRLIDYVVDNAQGNIAIATLRLELVHRAQNLAHIDAVRDRLPSNLLALFEACITSVAEQPDPEQQTVGLLAISAVAHTTHDLFFAELRKRLLKVAPQSGFRGEIALRSPEDVLQAAKGLLVMRHLDPIQLVIYHPDFYNYVRQNYNELLFRRTFRA